MKTYALLLIVLFNFMTFSDINAQGENPWPTKHKNVFVEFLGNGLFISTNFDMRFKRGVQDGLGFRAGIGGVSLEASDVEGSQVRVGLVTFPLAVNYLVGKGRSSFETGLGVTVLYASAAVRGGDIDIEADGVGAIGVINFGYRYQPKNNGFMFRINYSPIFGGGGFAPGWFGIGLGFGFK